MKKNFTLLFSFLFLSVVIFAQNKGAKNSIEETWTPIQYHADATTVIFIDDMNGVNDIAGLNARGWFFDDVDGPGTTTIFQGNPAVFNAYEGPDSGYAAENYNGAAGGGLLIDQWLISPAITVSAGDTLKFWHRSPDGSSWVDPLEVWVSTTAGTTASDFDVQLDAFNASITGWAQWIGTFPTDGTVRFAVRYYTTDGGPGGSESNYVGLDLFEVVSGGSGPTLAFMDDFSDSTLVNWTITNDSTGNCVWEIHDASEYSMPPTSVGNVLAADADACGSGGTPTATTATISTPFNFSDWSIVSLQWDQDFRVLRVSDEAYVEVSTDDSTWTTVASWIGVDGRDTSVTVDISAIAGGQSTVWLRFRTIQPLWDWWWAIDNVAIYVDGYIPVELISFSATVNDGDVNLRWSTATETNNRGFEIERNSGDGYEAIGYVPGFGTSAETHSYSFIDTKLPEGTYTYRLKQIDFDGSFEYSNIVQVDVTHPKVFSLEQNYPNPFNPSTNIKFSIAVDSKVTLKVFDILGQEVTTLLNKNLAAGNHQIQFDASTLNSGVYFYRIEAVGVDGTQFTAVKKMVLTK